MDPQIFCWVNSGADTTSQVVMAMAEDGVVLANHLSSSSEWAMHDIGYNSDWKHDLYRQHYPHGYVLVWVDKPLSHPGLQRAYRKNQASGPYGLDPTNASVSPAPSLQEPVNVWDLI